MARKINEGKAFKICEELRNSGYTVVIWTPEETKGVQTDYLQERITELGNEVIEDLK
jgi:hypothetical protein